MSSLEEPVQAACLSSDFYMLKKVPGLHFLIEQVLARALVSLVTDYLGVRVVTEGDIVLTRGGDQTWIPVRLSATDVPWRMERLVASAVDLLHQFVSENKVDGCIPFLCDTYPVENFYIDSLVGTGSRNFAECSLARFLFCSTDPNDCGPRVIRMGAEANSLVVRAEANSLWGWPKMSCWLPQPRCERPAYWDDGKEATNNILEHYGDPVGENLDDHAPYDPLDENEATYDHLVQF